MYKLSIDHSDRVNPFRVDGQPVTVERYMSVPMYTGLKAATVTEAIDCFYRVEDETGGSKSIALSVVEMHYGKEYAMEVGRNV